MSHGSLLHSSGTDRRTPVCEQFPGRPAESCPDDRRERKSAREQPGHSRGRCGSRLDRHGRRSLQRRRAFAANYAAGILGGIALGLIADRWGPGPSTLFGDVLLALGMGTMLLLGSPPAFIALYFVLHFGRNIEDSAIPFGTTVIVPPERMGAFSSARLMVLYASSAVGAILSGFLFANYSPVLVFALGAALKAANGVWFWWVFRSKPAKESAPQPGEGARRDGVAA